MPTITKKQSEEYERLRCDRDNGCVLMPDGLRLVEMPEVIISELQLPALYT